MVMFMTMLMMLATNVPFSMISQGVPYATPPVEFKGS